MSMESAILTQRSNAAIRHLLWWLCASGIVLLLCGVRSDGDAERTDRLVRNVVVFVADDHGQDTGAYGNPVSRTPHLDTFAEEGTLFTQAFATTANCSASRWVILTGLHNHRNGQYGHTHDFHHFRTYDHIKSLPVLLAEGGYRTASAGKYHVAPEEVYHFQEYIEGDVRDVRRHLPDSHGLHGRSFLSLLEQEHPEGWDEINASHTFHEIQMYYPMRVVRGRDYKLIWNVAHKLPYPFAADLWDASTWQHPYQQGMDTPFGVRSVREYIHRPAFELYDMRDDPWESENLAYRPGFAEILAKYQEKMWSFAVRTSDPWLLKWKYE